MADQDRWTNDRNRARWASDDLTSRGYEDYGRRSESSGRYDEDRSFGSEYETGGSSQDARRSGAFGQSGGGRDGNYGRSSGGGSGSYGQSSYGQGSQGGYGQTQYARGAQGGYGGYGDQGSYGQGTGGGYGTRYGQDYSRSQGDYGQRAYAQDSYNQGSYGQGSQSGYGDYGSSSTGSQYGGSSLGSRSYGQGSSGQGAYGSDSGRYGGALGYGASEFARTPHYADPDWSPRHQGGQDEHRGWMERTGEKIANFFGADIHRGRGPKNYTRSDDRIREDANDRLTDDPYIDASEIDVQVSGAEVTLTGTVGSREEKRRAEDCVEQISGVRHVQNNLRIQQPSQGYGGMSGGSTSASSTTGSTMGAAGASSIGASSDSQTLGTTATGASTSSTGSTGDMTSGSTGSAGKTRGN